ncbi:P-loop containing nucleoside triphosphate hydrolase protein [Chaetomium tenue]|uniref:P-loop containing nucleoside triphosphate hydrolase protein n=1 Tax=Chaetomium tenue TaxID=1854479 RepID=A0ACB7PGR5_9PEZI|nr:P-loop containing nucleoside triphosphate hydrolase protein [Chaetomium globosum]
MATLNGAQSSTAAEEPVAPIAMDQPDGGKLEVKYLYRKLKDGESKITESIEDAKEEHVDEDDFVSYPLVSIQNFDSKNKATGKKLRINSHHICDAIEETVKFYPAHKSGFKPPLEVDEPFEVLVHHFQQLESYKNSMVQDSEPARHLDMFIRYLGAEPALKRSVELISHKLITFDLLWAAFKPGSYVLTKEYGQPRLYWLQSTSKRSSYFDGDSLRLECLHTDNDGTTTGSKLEHLSISEDEFPKGGHTEITSLSAFPIDQLEDRGLDIKDMLSERGKWFYDLMESGPAFRQYEGLCLHYHEEKKEDDKWVPSSIAGRVMIDTKAFLEENPREGRRVKPWPGPKDTSDKTTARPEDTKMLCSPYVHGFCLGTRTWCRFFLDKKMIVGITWEPNMWKDLIFPDLQKKLVRSMVMRHSFPTEAKLRDEDALKGKGLVIMSHGPPGTGKTLTAVAVAEEAKKPVIFYPAGELGSTPGSVQSGIKNIIRYATRWKAILLLDEADIFLESRQSGGQANLERNALVAVFLRQLEYSQGIIFLTSNRAQMFDAAIKSRIHLTLFYGFPTIETRRQLWDQILGKIPDENRDFEKARVLRLFSKHTLNGREISNLVNSAQTLARSTNAKPTGDGAGAPNWKLTQAHLQDVIKIWEASNPPRTKEMAKTTLRLVMDLTVPALTLFVLLGLAVIVSFHGYEVVVKRRDILILYR